MIIGEIIILIVILFVGGLVGTAFGLGRVVYNLILYADKKDKTLVSIVRLTKLFFSYFVIGAGLVLLAVVLMFVYLVCVKSNNYYMDDGWGGFCRTPLVYPYEMDSIDSLDHGHIGKWQENSGHVRMVEKGVDSHTLDDITDFYRKDNIVVGKIDKGFMNEHPAFFIFSCLDGKSSYYHDEVEWLSACQAMGVQSPELKSVEDQHNQYWDEHR